MSREEALAQLRAIKRQQDKHGILQEHHEDADDILLKLIDDPRITVAFEQIKKWYA